MKLVKCFKSLSVVLLLIAVSHLPAMAAIEATFVAPQEQHLGKLKALGDAFVRDRDALDTETKQKRDKIAEEKVSLHNQLVAMTDLPWDQAWHKKVAGIHALQDAAEEEDIEALRVHDDREAALSARMMADKARIESDYEAEQSKPLKQSSGNLEEEKPAKD